jgi:transcriptional regulator with XRE-family HTH domain
MPSVMPREFWEWLDGVIEQYGPSERKFAEKVGIAPSVISKARTNVQPISWDACKAIADFIGVPPEKVFRLAGLLPQPLDWQPEFDEWMGVFQDLSDDDKAELLTIARMKRQRKQKVKA